MILKKYIEKSDESYSCCFVLELIQIVFIFKIKFQLICDKNVLLYLKINAHIVKNVIWVSIKWEDLKVFKKGINDGQ